MERNPFFSRFDLFLEPSLNDCLYLHIHKGFHFGLRQVKSAKIHCSDKITTNDHPLIARVVVFEEVQHVHSFFDHFGFDFGQNHNYVSLADRRRAVHFVLIDAPYFLDKFLVLKNNF